ncbi:MAG: GNAT family N-acetyltransferase [Anaerolineales bacterium]
MDHPKQIDTPRMVLRHLQATDADTIYDYLQEPEIAMNVLSIPYPYTRHNAITFIEWATEKMAEQPTFVLERRSDEQMLGVIGAMFEAPHRRVEIGYWLGKPHWGQGYMSEAARVLVRYIFDAYPSVQRIYAECFPYNVGSARIMQNAGMQYEGTLRQHVFHAIREENMDVDFYALLRQDYIGQQTT